MLRMVTTAGAVGGIVAVWLPGGAVRPDRPDLDVALGALALVGVAALSFSPWRPARPVAGVLAAGATAWALWWLVRDILSGLPGSSTAVLAAASVVVLAGVVAAAVRPLHGPVGAGLVVVLVAAAVGAGLLAPRVPARAAEAAEVPVAAVADGPGERRWTWRSDGGVRAVVVAGAGVVVATEGGELTGLDGPTGAARWRYARPGAHVRSLAATPDRATVVAGFAPGGGRETGSALLVVLDAVTGTVLRESTVDTRVVDPDLLAPTDTVLPVRDRRGDVDDAVVRGTDLRTGEELWTWTAPPGCVAPFHLPRSGGDVVLTTVRCAAESGVVALDERTGQRRWEHLVPVTGSRAEITLGTSPDGALVAVEITAAGPSRPGERLLRSTDGTELTTVTAGRDVLPGAGVRPLVVGADGGTDGGDDGGADGGADGGGPGPEVVDPATGDRTELAPADCPGARSTTTTATMLLRICFAAGDALLTWQPLTGGPLSRTPLEWAPDPAPGLLLGSAAQAVVLPAPGAIVVARADDRVVAGYPAA